MAEPSSTEHRSPRRKPAGAPAFAAATRPDARSQLAAIVEHSNDAIFSRAMDGMVTTWNAAAERIFGHRAEDIIGHSSRVLLPRGQRDEFRWLISRLQRGDVVQHYDTERLRKDGRRIRVSLTLSPIRDLQRRLIGFSTIARDVTENQQVKELLSRREHQLQDLFDEATVGLVLITGDGKINRANQAFLDLLQRSMHEVQGRSLLEFHPDAAAAKALLERLANRQTLRNVPTELLARDGQRRPVLVDANALWECGRFIHSRWFVRDISRRKQLERELLELSERERRSFAQELHDGLGQQLGGVAYLCNVLRGKLAERCAPEAAEAAHIFERVREAIEHTRRISRGLSPIAPEPVGLMVALRELAQQTAGLFRVRCRFACRKPVLVEDSALAGHLFRIAQEAVNNALKHGKPRNITIRLSRSRGKIALEVADDGKGIETLSPSRRGLGLHIMQYRAGLIRGAVNVQRRRCGGTEVVCTAPSVQAESASRAK